MFPSNWSKISKWSGEHCPVGSKLTLRSLESCATRPKNFTSTTLDGSASRQRCTRSWSMGRILSRPVHCLLEWQVKKLLNQTTNFWEGFGFTTPGKHPGKMASRIFSIGWWMSVILWFKRPELQNFLAWGQRGHFLPKFFQFSCFSNFENRNP